jgi:RNA polymerase sigma-70 factor (ECF subfamily)
MDELMSQDADDLRAARRGGPEGQRAMARLYDRHAPVVHAVCRQHLGSAGAGASDDALQETFIRAYRMLDRLDSPDRLRPWLYGIARLVCSEMRRAAGRRRRHEGAAAMNHAPASPRDADAPHENVSRAESLERLTEAIDRLPEQERLAVHLFYLDPDPVRAAKEALGLSRSGFYKLLARARDHLALSLREVRA